ncbi:MAG: Phenylalanine-tRNA ligase beta subunit, partial [candidate division CPR2 bacterium GW2011_GWC1_39_9]
MRIPTNWLKEYVKTSKSDKEIADILTMSGTEVEKIESHGITWSGVVVAEVIEIEKHPNADKLRLVTVNIGNKSQKVVCGASNIEVGQKIAFAKEGAKLGEFELKRVNIRGVESSGMCCSEAELGLSAEAKGIMVLDSSATVGIPLEEALNIGESVIEAEITPNRGDELSITGLAREVFAVTGEEFNLPEISVTEIDLKSSSDIAVEILDNELCPQYLARVLEIDEISQSPEWLKKHIEAAGVKTINLVVDITNYVMLEMGQPLHAFDYNSIEDKKIVIRRANKDEIIETLDGEKRKLDETMLVIADNKKAIAIAGVMGGKNSEISANTKKIVLESATFNKVQVRRTSDKLALRTEAVVRFEKGLPLNLAQIAIDRAAMLLQQIGGARIYDGTVSVGLNKEPEKEIELKIGDIEKKLGVIMAAEEAGKYLERLGFEVKTYEDFTNVSVPWWRPDVNISEDLLEEIIRIYGLNNITSSLPSMELPSPNLNKPLKVEYLIRDILLGAGFSEIINYSFYSPENAKKVGFDDKNLIKIANPINSDMEIMRPSMLPSILNSISKNERNYNYIKIYELGKTYLPGEEMPIEDKHLTLAISGINDEKVIYSDGKAFYLLKGALELIFAEIGIKNFSLKQTKIDQYHPGRTARIIVGDKNIGTIGEIHPDLQIAYGLKRPVAIADLLFDELVDLVNLVPVLGVTGLVTFVTQYQVELFWVGILFNLGGIVYITSRIIKFSARGGSAFSG